MTELQPFNGYQDPSDHVRNLDRVFPPGPRKSFNEILDVIEATIPEVRPELAPTAPKIDTIKIDVDKIKIVIGKGGRNHR